MEIPQIFALKYHWNFNEALDMDKDADFLLYHY
jgi:hypothetical protein